MKPPKSSQDSCSFPQKIEEMVQMHAPENSLLMHDLIHSNCVTLPWSSWSSWRFLEPLNKDLVRLWCTPLMHASDPSWFLLMESSFMVDTWWHNGEAFNATWSSWLKSFPFSKCMVIWFSSLTLLLIHVPHPTWKTIMILLLVTHEAAIPSKEDLSLLYSPRQPSFLMTSQKM